MLINSNTKIRNISADISPEELELAKAYIKDAVDNHCNTCPDNDLSVRILFGGENRNWAGTPLQCIYEFYCDKGSEHPYKSASKDVGWLFKKVLADDNTREFERVGKDTGSRYKLIV